MSQSLRLAGFGFLAAMAAGPAFSWGGLYDFPEREAATAEPIVQQEAGRSLPPAPAPMGAGNLLSDGIPSLSQAGHLPDVPLVPDRKPATSAAGPAAVMSGNPLGACLAAIMEAERRHGIPQDLLLAIGLQEAGTRREGHLTIWPWTVNSHGKGYVFETRAEAESFVRAEHAAGRRSTDIGCMQVNLNWHPDAFGSIDEGFDPATSADYAARYLLALKEEAGDWMVAAGNYHSKTPVHHRRYRDGLMTNLAVAEKRRADLAQLAALGGNYAKNGIESPRPIRQDRDIRRLALVPGAYSRQLARLDAADTATASRRHPAVIESSSSNGEAALHDGPWWTSQLSRDEAGGSSRSIYSGEDLEPVLPQLVAGGNSSGHPSTEP